METLEDAFEYDRALVLGIGGGGDVVGAVPTARLLETHGVETIVGGVAYERAEIDPRPGPRGLNEIENVERVSDTLALATGETRTVDGVEFAETGTARTLGEPVALLDLTGGARGVRAGLDAACAELDVGLVVGTDSGGDAIAAGDEPGLRSPLTDAVVLAALTDLEVESCLGVFGYGSDGELTLGELDDAVARIARNDGLLGAWGLTPRVRREMEDLIEVVPTEASRLPLEAARGEFGEKTIRGGNRSLELAPASTLTFYFDPAAVAETAELTDLAAGTDSFVAAHDALEAAGYRTELTIERERLDEE